MVLQPLPAGMLKSAQVGKPMRFPFSHVTASEACRLSAAEARTSRKLSGIQSSRRSGTPSMSVIQSADVTEPRMATTTLFVS